MSEDSSEQPAKQKFIIEIMDAGLRSLAVTQSVVEATPNAIGSRCINTDAGDREDSEAAFDKSPDALRGVFHPRDAGPYVPGAFCTCLYTGAVAQIVGVHPVRGKPALHMKFDIFNGAVPMTTDEKFFERWHIVKTTHKTSTGEDAPFLGPGSTYTVPAKVYPSSFSHELSRPQPFSLMSRICCKYAVDIAATTDQGLQLGMTVELMQDQRMDGSAAQYEVVGYALDTAVSLHLMCRKLGAATTEEIKKMPGGAILKIVSLFSPRKFLPEPRPASREGRTTSASEPPEDPSQPLQCTFKYKVGPRQASMQLLDADPKRCEFYFGVIPGERTSAPQESTAIGMQVCGKKVQMFYHCDGAQGAGVFTEDTSITLTGEIVRVPEALGVPAPSSFFPKITGEPTGKFVVPLVPENDEYNYTFPFYTGGGVRTMFDIDALSKYGLRIGQRCLGKGSRLTVLGIAKDPGERHLFCPEGHELQDFAGSWMCDACQRKAKKGEKSKGCRKCDFDVCKECIVEKRYGGGSNQHIWFIVDERPWASYFEPGAEMEMFDCYAEIQPIKTRTMIYNKVHQRGDLPLKQNFCFRWGREKTELAMFDADAARCKAYFGLNPGSRVDGNSTVVGMRLVKENKVEMAFLADGDNGCGTYTDGTSLEVDDEVSVELRCHIQGRLLRYKNQQLDPEYPIVPKACYSIGTRTASMQPVDNDAETVRHYFGVVPGQRIDGDATVIGVMYDEKEGVQLFTHVDISPGAGTYNEGTSLCVLQDVHSVEYHPLQDFKPIEVREVDEDPNFPLKLNFPFKSGVGKGNYITYYDVRPEAVQHYFHCRPGERADGELTIVGMRRSAKTGKVQLWSQMDSSSGAGTFEGTKVLHKDPDPPRGLFKRFVPPSVHPFPSGPFKAYALPQLKDGLANPRNKFPILLGGNLMLVDCESLVEITDGALRQGQRVVKDETPATMVGVISVDGDVQYVAHVDGTAIGTFSGGTQLLVSQEFYDEPRANVTQIKYADREQLSEVPLRMDYMYKTGVKVASFEHLDKDPDRCYSYFMVRPGERIDGTCTVVGLGMRSNKVKLFAHVDGNPGAGSWSDNTPLWIENGLIYPIEPTDNFTDAEPDMQEESGMEEGALPYTESELFQFTLPTSQSELFVDGAEPTADDRAFPQYFKSSLRALRAVRKRSDQMLSPNERNALLDRLEKAGLTDPEAALQLMTAFLSHEVPLISWFKPFKHVTGLPQIEAMANDFCLRTLFELQHSNGLQSKEHRNRWEHDLFAGAYDVCQPYQRPKYGLFNLFGDPEGQKVPREQYGDCYFVFTDDLRQRTTMTPFDSSGVSHRSCPVCTVNVGTEGCYAQFKEKSLELETFAEIAVGKRRYAISDDSYYKEAQFHGALYLDQHILAIVIADRYMSRIADLHMLYNFAVKNACWIVSMRTMHRMVDMRLRPASWLKAKFDELVADGAIHWSALVSGNGQQPVRLSQVLFAKNGRLLCEPQSLEARRWFECLQFHYMCVEMDVIREKIAASLHTTWKEERKKVKEPKHHRERPRSGPPAEAEGRGEDDAEGGGGGDDARMRALLERAMQGGGLPDCPTS